MYVTHPLLQEPPDSARLWRYMDFAKFLHLLDAGTLHLAALRTFNDPFEGYPTRSVVTSISTAPSELTPEAEAERRAKVEGHLRLFRRARDKVFASCWHINEQESAGMWTQYVRAGEGIAVQTTFARLKEAIDPQGLSVSGARVQYVDFDSFVANETNVVSWAALKRESFAHENEFRLIHFTLLSGPSGFALPVKLGALIENVYVAPTTPDWLYKLVMSLLAKFQFQLTVHRSTLADSPEYLASAAWPSRD